MNPKRKAGGRARAGDSVVSRLLRRRARERFARYGAAREWVRGEPRRAQQAVLTARFRRAVTGLVVLAFAMGTLASPYVIRRLQGDDRDAAAVLVQSIAIQGNHRLTAPAIAKLSGVAPDSLASQVDAEQVALNLRNHPWIQFADAALLPDGKLVIRIEEREPVALVRGPSTPGGAKIWRLIDDTGTPYARTRADEWSRLPRFRSERVLTTGEVDSALTKALEIVRLMRGQPGWRPTKIEVELPSEAAGRGWVLHSRTLPRTVILGDDDIEPRLERLALLLDSDLPSTRGAAEIDLRFADLAVLRSRSPSR